MTAATRKRPRDPKALFWAMVPVLLLGGLLGMQLLLLSSALDDPSFSVETEYYQKALSWDAKMAQDRENTRLGWTASLTTAGFAEAGAVTVTLTDAAGSPVTGAALTVEAFPNARAGARRGATLAETAPGTYSAALPLARAGLWEFRLDARRGADHFTAVVRRDVAGGGPP